MAGFGVAAGLGVGQRLRPVGRRGRAPRAHPPDVIQEVDALDQLHREEPLVLLREELVERDEVPVGDVRERSKLVLEPVERVGLGAPQCLHRDHAPALAVVRAIDDPEASGAQTTFDREPLGSPEVVRRFADHMISALSM